MAAVQTRRKRKLGQFLHALRKRAGKTEADYHALTRKTQSTLSRMENGYISPSWTELGALLGLYGASESERREAEALWEDAKQDGTRLVHAAAFTPEARTYARQEADATEVRTIEMIVIPGLLQTPAYAAAIRLAGRRFLDPSVSVEQAIAALAGRQRRLPQLTLHAVIDEAALHRVVGGREVMRAQLLHLLEAAKQPNITIRVIPFGAGAYGTMSGGGATALRFEEDDPSAVYLEYAGGGKWVDNPADVQNYLLHFDEIITEVALSPKESASLIRTLATALKET
ncbi:helix-turn-helix domain-containing protein [Saccharothrix coeruleofusca]|uniref:Transcriptional regulator n=1 Tax=Saccharothrix coeruleofusca TaxID=33919 RepID=A0A918AKA5_9PSEU|nr:helix-turn-helix transcriptional regulator [Saccharothrix coeruleofusca]MBP2334507.1 transcriptional regulator with XRE-family HTH domain [Saccharothrix coeruleofusca]GGP40535.1 transcriptional regulator [Saccharothrix coeruleofusca]